MTDQTKYFEEKFRGIHAKIDGVSVKLEEVHQQTLKTNGRVTSLEEQTAVTRFLHRNPRVLLGTFAGAVVMPRNLIWDHVYTFVMKMF